MSEADIISLTIPSHPRYLYVVRSAVYPVVLEAGFSRKDARLIVLALDEACSNIIKHAYEGDTKQQIALNVTVTNTDIRFELRDNGKQVDTSRIAPRKLADIRPGGLGTYFLNAAFDSVRYDTSGARGTVLTLIKKRPLAREVRA